MAYHEKTINAAKGRWRGILLQLGFPETALKDKHGPCPLCQSKNNFRWDNKDGSGSYICTCSAGDGIRLAMEFMGKPFQDAAAQVDDILKNVKPSFSEPKRDMTDDQRKQILRATYSATQPIEAGDLADKYLTARGVGEVIYPKALRFGVLKDGEGGVRPCMVAMVCGPDGKPVTMHRTFLRPDGLAKAEMEAPRKLMPGLIPDGSCVQLSEYHGTGALGVAEGIETAMSASGLYDMPVWAAINANMLAKWTPPEGCTEVAVFCDNDPKFAGQAAGYTLAHKLAVKGLKVTVHIPPIVGTDYNDVLMQRKRP